MGQVIAELKVLPDEFERCYNNGGFNPFVMKSIIAYTKRVYDNAGSGESEPSKRRGANISPQAKNEVSVSSMIDQTTLISQINLDKKFNGKPDFK